MTSDVPARVPQTWLLALLRQTRPRLMEARATRSGMASQRSFSSLLGTVLALQTASPSFAGLPWRVGTEVRFLLAVRGHAASKTGIAAAELEQAGAPGSAIFPAAGRNPERGYGLADRLVRLGRVALRAPRAALFALYLRRRGAVISPIDAATLIALDGYRRFFARHPWLVSIAISDMSPRQALLAAGAAVAGARAVWWQNDYHYTEPPLLGFWGAAVVSRQGADGAKRTHPHAIVFRWRSPGLEPVRECPARGAILGVAVNADFTGSAAEIAAVRSAAAALKAARVELRLHPRHPPTVGARVSEHAWLAVAPREEAHASFARRVDVVICGNSGVQLPLLAAGTPVIHVPGLDPLGFDWYGYVAQGMIFGRTVLDEGAADLMNAHYATKAHEPLLQAIMGPPDPQQARPLEDLVAIVSR